jgi:hypothetical protein
LPNNIPAALRLPIEVLATLHSYGWNQRVLTYELFEDFCAHRNITIISAPRPYDRPGEYKVERGRDMITLDRDLSGPDLTVTAWHEAGHYLLHYPAKFGRSQKTETQADMVGYTAVLPLHLIRDHDDWDLINDYNYPAKFLHERRTLYDIYGY